MQFLKDFLLSITVLCVAFLLPYQFFISLGYRNGFALGGAMIICSFIQALLMNYDE